MSVSNSPYNFESKVNPSLRSAKFNDPEVYNHIKRLYENSDATLDYISEHVLVSKTKLKIIVKDFKRRSPRNRICPFIAHCLISEHGFSNSEAAKALGVAHSSLCRMQRRTIKDFEVKYAAWKKEHTKWRRSLIEKA